MRYIGENGFSQNTVEKFRYATEMNKKTILVHISHFEMTTNSFHQTLYNISVKYLSLSILISLTTHLI
jgi:hypothetical protein